MCSLGRALPLFAVLGCAAASPPSFRLVAPDDRAEDGLLWSLGALGAAPEDRSGLRWVGPGLLQLDPGALGLPPAAAAVLAEAIAEAGQTDEQRLFGGVDLGRLLLATLYTPARYYAATGACDRLEGWLPRLSRPETFEVTDSLLTEGPRRVTLQVGVEGIDEIALMATLSAAGAPVEVIDRLPNGRERYATYDADGGLIVGEMPAGQPGRCMWCHEDHLMVPIPQEGGDWGSLSYDALVAELAGQEALVEAARAAGPAALPTNAHEVHPFGERLVEAFLGPNAARLAAEWSVTPAEAVAAVMAAGGTFSVNTEHPDYGPVTTRAAAERALQALLPDLVERAGHPLEGADPAYVPWEVPDSAREPMVPGKRVEGRPSCGG